MWTQGGLSLFILYLWHTLGLFCASKSFSAILQDIGHKGETRLGMGTMIGKKRVIECPRMSASFHSVQTERRQWKGPWLQTNALSHHRFQTARCACAHTRFHGELESPIPERICCFSWIHQDLCHMFGKKGETKTRLRYFDYLLGGWSISNKSPLKHQRF